MPFERARAVPPIHVAQRDEVLALNVSQIASALPTDANPGDVQFLIG
jgi:hypothetical protein